MSKEQIIDEAYGNYASQQTNMFIPIWSQDEFVNKCKTNPEFSKILIFIYKEKMKDLKQFIKTTIREFLNEQHSNDTDLINMIKKSLIMETLVDEDEFNELYNGDQDLAWKKFIDDQENGDCQGIVSGIIYNFKNVNKVFGEIEVDEPYIDEYGDEQTLMTHHWITINGKIYDFSKGTLRDYINWDVYDVNVDGDEWRYN